MRVYFTTVVRNHPHRMAGEVVCLDWNSKTVKASSRLAPVADQESPNPRGGNRGGRGVQVKGEHVFVLGHDALFSFSLDLSESSCIFVRPDMGAHELLLTEGGALIAATGLDSVISTSGDDVDLLKDSRLTALLPEEASPVAGDQFHLNAIALWNGDLLALCNRLGAIVNTSTGTVVMQDDLLVGAHNLVVVGDEAYIVATSAKSLILVDLPTGTVKRQWPVEGSRFARGLAIFGRSAFIGTSPGATILHLDLDSGEVVDSFVYNLTPSGGSTAVHGLCVVT